MINVAREYKRISAIIQKFIASISIYEANITHTVYDVTTFIDYNLTSWIMEAFKILTLKSIYPLKNDFYLPDFISYIHSYNESYALDANVDMGAEFFSYIDEGIVSYNWHVYPIYITQKQFKSVWPNVVLDSMNTDMDLDYGEFQYYLIGNRVIADFIKNNPSGNNLKELICLLSSHVGNQYGTSIFDPAYDSNSFLFSEDEVFFGQYIAGYDKYDIGCSFLLSTYIVFQEIERIMETERRLYGK